MKIIWTILFVLFTLLGFTIWYFWPEIKTIIRKKLNTVAENFEAEEGSKQGWVSLFLKFIGFIWGKTPISLFLTALVGYWVAGSWFCNLIGLNFLLQRIDLLPFSNDNILWVVEYSIRGLFSSLWFVSCLQHVKQRYIMVITIFKQRIAIPFTYFHEGWKATILPRIILSGVQDSIVEITIGIIKKEGEEDVYKKIKCQTLDEQEIELEQATQVRTFDPFKWKNVEMPDESIENTLLAQLRIIIALFKAEDLNSLKGAVAGMLLGREYLVWRNASDGELLRTSGRSVLSVESNPRKIKEILEKPTDEITRKCLTDYLSSLEGPDTGNVVKYQHQHGEHGPKVLYFAEVIPSNIFDLQAVYTEAYRVGAEIQPPSIKDITPPKEVRDAATQKRVEELEGGARLEENLRHSKAALETLGLSANTKPADLNPEQHAMWRALMDDQMVQEDKATKIIIDSGSSSDIGDKILGAAQINQRGKK